MNTFAKKTGFVSLRSVWENPIHFIACGFGVGTIPIMPGTFGTGLGVVLYFMLAKMSLPFYLTINVLLLLTGVYLCGKINRDLKTEDHPAAVWDELASFPLVMIGVPQQLTYLIAGFILFRFFDIYKPIPIRWVDRHIHGGVGVMLDDVLAAFFAWAILFVTASMVR